MAVELMNTADPLTTSEQCELVLAEDKIRAGLDSFIQVGEALARVRDGRLYRETHATFASYCEEKWGLSRRHAYQLIDASEVVENLSAMAHTGIQIPTNERQARPLARLDPEQQQEAWERAVETAPNGKVTARHVESVVRELSCDDLPFEPDPDLDIEEVDTAAGALAQREEEASPAYRGPILTSKSNEWYTPETYVEAAREVLGFIDLDPASCEQANATVQALTFYTEADDGLMQPWSGRVWLNPPYGTDEAGISNAGRWAARLIHEFHVGNVHASIICVNALTSAPWFKQLWDFPVCFTDHRIHFDAPSGSGEKSRPQNGTAFVYLGPDEAAFARVFSEFGAVVRRIS